VTKVFRNCTERGFLIDARNKGVRENMIYKRKMVARDRQMRTERI